MDVNEPVEHAAGVRLTTTDGYVPVMWDRLRFHRGDGNSAGASMTPRCARWKDASFLGRGAFTAPSTTRAGRSTDRWISGQQKLKYPATPGCTRGSGEREGGRASIAASTVVIRPPTGPMTTMIPMSTTMKTVRIRSIRLITCPDAGAVTEGSTSARLVDSACILISRGRSKMATVITEGCVLSWLG